MKESEGKFIMFSFEKNGREYACMKNKNSIVLIMASVLMLSACGSTQQDVVNEGKYFSEEATAIENLSEENSESSTKTYVTSEIQLENKISEPIEEFPSEEQESEYTSEEIKELFFGEWEVSKLLGFSEVQNDYTNYPDGHDIIGNQILINENAFSSVGLEKYERYQSEVLNPTYEVSDIKQQYLIYDMNESIKEEPELYDMIVNDELQDLEIKDRKRNCYPAVRIMISSNKKLIILTMDGAFYLLEKVQ